MLSGSASGQEGLQYAVTRSNNMNSKVNKRVGQLPENLRLNGRTPSGKPRLFVCQICTRAFARQEHLTRHERSHTKEKPYSCGICNRNFSRRDLLLRHANKIHGGSFGDSIIKHNKDSGSKVAKRANTGTAASANAEAGSESVSRAGRRSSHCAHPPTVKRRASYSAQSGKYVAPVQNRDTHKLDRVRFSTPELLPIDLLESGEETISRDLEPGADDFSLDDGEPSKVPQAQDVPMASPNDFNLLDSVNWINDYNNEPLHTSEAGTGTGTGTARTRTETANSANISPDSNNGNFNLQASIARPSNSMNIRSSWSINETDGGLQMKSLFSTVSPSSSSKDNSVLPNSSTANSNSWLRPPSELLTNNDLRGSPSFNVSGACSDEIGNPPLENQEQDLDLLQSCTPYAQSILPQLAETEEKQPFLEPLLDRFDATAGTLADIVADTIPENDYTAYGMDYLTLSHITRAIPPSNENSNPDLPSSKIFTPELRQMCMDASAYYGDYFNQSDGVRVSKELILPNCRELNLYVSYFREFFNSHHPVIHPDFFNLDLTSLKNYVHEGFEADDENDRNLQFSNLACLPLFVATVGSLFKPEPNAKTTTLYEISRRVLHVFLERRKEQHHPNQKGRSAHRSGQHVWLIQSLSLSIIYTLFADSMGKVDSEMIKRQVSAVCSIIKNNFLTAISYDSVSGAASGPGGPNNSKQQETGSSEINDFFSYVMFESKIRCTLIAYKFCQFLRIFYNVEAKLFLSELDIEPICIPDDEITWNRASLFLPHEPMKKSNVTSFRKFYDSFTFNHSGMKPIPESLASIMLYYEFNISTHSTFHVFLTRIDIKKLEKNLSQIQSQLNLDDINNLKSNYTSTLKSDSIVLRNCLMTMNFLLRVDRNFGSKVWHGKMKDLFDSFINPRTLNILSKGSYSLLTDFLVALNSSIKNIANVFKLDGSKTKIHLNKRIMSMFNLQAYHNDFLMLLKFIMDFEHKPNFKLLCIFKELKRLADRLLIPFLSQKYPLDFAQFEDVSTVNNHIQQNVNSLPDSSIHYSSINVEGLEKLINNVLVYSFNDSSFLKMSGQLNNEFTFNKDHPTYDPFDLSTTEFIMPLESTSKSHDYEIDSAQTQQNFTSSEAQTVESTGFDGKMESTFPHSPFELMSIAPNKESSDKIINSSDFKQGFAERYRLSEKYVVIAKCFFTFVRESYVNCHILDRITNDFQQLKYCLDEERDRFLALVPTRSEEIHDSKNFSHPAIDSAVSPFNHIENLHNDTSSDVFDMQMSSRV